MDILYIAKKQRTNKHGEKVLYLYLAESRRIDGIVKNSQRYITNFKTSDLLDEVTISHKIEEIKNKFSSEEIVVIHKKIKELQEALLPQ